MMRQFSAVAIVTSVLALPGAAFAQLAGYSSIGNVTTVTNSSLAHPALINPNVVLPGTAIGTPTQLVIDPGLPGLYPSIVGQPLIIVPAAALSNTTFGSTLGTTQIYGVPTQIYGVPTQIYGVPTQYGVPTVPVGSAPGVPVGNIRVIEAPTSYPVNPIPAAFTRTAIAKQLTTSPGVMLLDAALLEATCQQDWRKAVQIVDRAIGDTPQDQFVYRSQLQDYRNRLQALAGSKTVASNWRAQCTGG